MTWTKRELKKSFPCNGAYIKYLRKRKGWSQKQLVQASGYSLRLILKAESDGRIVLQTLLDLAQALSTESEVIQPEQLILEPIGIAKFITHATYVFQRDMYEQLSHIVKEDIEIEFFGDLERFPFVGRYHGLEGFKEAIDKYFSCMEVPENVSHTKWHDYYSQLDNPNVVVVWGKSWIHPIGCPNQAPLDITQKIEFRDGKVSRFETRYEATIVPFPTAFSNSRSA